MNGLKRSADFGLLMLLAFLIGSTPVQAQQEPSPENTSQLPKAAGTNTPWAIPAVTQDETNAKSAAPGPANPYAASLKQAGTGLPLFGTSSTPLRWGNFSVGTFEYIGIHDDFQSIGPAPAFGTTLSIFRTSLMYDRFIRKSRIVLQYVPQMAIVNGEIHANAGANNTFALGSTFELTPRMSLTVQDNFVNVHSNQLVPEHYLAADANAGALVQNNFLDTNGSFLANTVSATVEYKFSSRTTFTATPVYRYARTLGNQQNYFANGQTYQGTVTLGHALSPHRTIGLMESYQYLDESTGKSPVIARFNTSGIFYSEQLARTLWITGNVGAEHQTYSDLQGAPHWGFSGGFSVVSNLSNRIGMTLAYARGLAFANYVTTRLSDRVDALVGVNLSSRIVWTNGVGYFRETGPSPRTNGKYATTGFEYRFYGHFSFFTNFAYGFQNSDTPQLISGSRNTVSWGLRWKPPFVPPQ